MHEVRSIPAAPRRVRAGPILAHRWPMALIGGVMVAFGGLLSWMLFLAAGAKPSDQHWLDEGDTAEAPGVVTRVDESRIRAPDGSWWQWVHYDFTYDGNQMSSASMAPADTCSAGMTVRVEVIPQAPRINRIVGSKLHFDRAWLEPESWIAAVVVPGALLLLGWLAGAFHLRHVLIYGDVSTGKVRRARPVPWLLPEVIEVTFEFRDHRAVLRRGRHWVRARSALGAQVQHQMHTGWFEPLPVLHDRRFPQWNRLVLARDFLRPQRSGAELEVG